MLRKNNYYDLIKQSYMFYNQYIERVWIQFLGIRYMSIKLARNTLPPIFAL
jgi:hypothetical protein